MINPSEYPNLKVTKGFGVDAPDVISRKIGDSTLYVWQYKGYGLIRRHRMRRQSSYRFPTLEDALKAANDMVDDKESWKALKSFKEKGWR